MDSGLWVAGLLFLLLALALLGLGRRGRRESGLPTGRLVYLDHQDWQEPPAPLQAPRYGLVGRPDYLVRQGRTLIPVELKPSRQASTPYEADILQLAAYCLLVEETTGVRPPHGLLRYANGTFEIPFNEDLREELLDLLEEMRAAEEEGEQFRSHDQPVRCAACAMREHCGEALS